MTTIRLLLALCLCPALVPLASAQSRANPAAQRDAMRKLSFMVGTWSGEASITLPSGQSKRLRQVEDVSYRLDGLVLVVEGTGRNEQSGAVEFNAFATIAHDERTGTYRIRAYNEGNYLDTELVVRDRGFEWGFTSGPAAVRNVMALDETGRWIETTEVAINGGPARRTMEMRVQK